MGKAFAAAGLALRFLAAVVVSGLQTARIVVRSRIGGAGPPAAFLRIPFAPMSPRGAALLGCMVTLTPGTTTLDVDMEALELVVHVLDASDADAVVDGIRRSFEPGLVALFGAER